MTKNWTGLLYIFDPQKSEKRVFTRRRIGIVFFYRTHQRGPPCQSSHLFRGNAVVVVLSWPVNCFLQCNRCRKKNTTKNTRFSFAPVLSSACNKSRDENDASVIRLSFAFVIICYADYFVLLFFFLVLPQMLIWLISAGFLQHSFSLIKSATVVLT